MDKGKLFTARGSKRKGLNAESQSEGTVAEGRPSVPHAEVGEHIRVKEGPPALIGAALGLGTA